MGADLNGVTQYIGAADHAVLGGEITSDIANAAVGCVDDRIDHRFKYHWFGFLNGVEKGFLPAVTNAISLESTEWCLPS